MFLQQQASPVVHTVGGSGEGGGRGEREGKGGRGREKGRGRGRGGGREGERRGREGGRVESTLHDTKDQWSRLLPTFSVARYVSKKTLRKEASNKAGTHAREWLAT